MHTSGIEFAMDDFSNVEPVITYSQPFTDNFSDGSDYDKIKFKDIFESDNSQSNSVSLTTSDDEYLEQSRRKYNATNNIYPEVSFSDLVLQERARLNFKPPPSRIVNRTGKMRSKFMPASRLLDVSSFNNSKLSPQSTIDTLLDDKDSFTSTQNHVETNDFSSIQDSNHAVPTSDSFPKKRATSKRSSPRRLTRTKSSDDSHDNQSGRYKPCEACKKHTKTITTLEADLAVEKQHIEEMCKTISELKEQLDRSMETIGNMTKHQNHLLNDKDLKIQQLNDRNAELIKRIEMNVNDINYFKNCLLENHNKLEALQSKLNLVTNENNELTSSIDRYKTEIEKLTNSNNNYKKELSKQNFKRLDRMSSLIEKASEKGTHLLSLPSTRETAAETVRATDPNVQILYNMPTIENNIFPSTLSSNMCSIYTTTDGDDLDQQFNNDSENAKNNEDEVDKKTFKSIINKDLINLTAKTSTAKDKNLPRKNSDIPLNPTTKWILDRVSRPSNMESLFKLQDKIRDMSLKM